MMIKCVKDILQDDFWIMPSTPEFIDEGIPYITSKNIKNGKIDFNRVSYISQESFEKISKNRPILIGDILISMIGTLGETAEVTVDDGLFYGQNMFLVRLDETKVNKRYFLNYFKSDFVARALSGSQNQSTQKYLKANHIEDLQIPIPPLEQQEYIAYVLDKISELIIYRKQQLAKFDELVKARFVEMFGDVITNTQSWETYIWADVLSIKNGRNQKQVENPNGQYPICGSGGVMGYADKYISKENSVIIGRKGNINKPILMREKYWNVDTAFGLEPKTDILLVDFLYLYCVLFDFELLNKAVTIPSLTKADLLKIEMPVPPIELQNQFATFVEQVDKSKVAVQKALDEAQTLFDSLMQQYFG